MHPTSGANSSLAGSSGMVLGNNLTSPSGPIPGSVRYMLNMDVVVSAQLCNYVHILYLSDGYP